MRSLVSLVSGITCNQNAGTHDDDDDDDDDDDVCVCVCVCVQLQQCSFVLISQTDIFKFRLVTTYIFQYYIKLN